MPLHETTGFWFCALHAENIYVYPKSHYLINSTTISHTEFQTFDDMTDDVIRNTLRYTTNNNVMTLNLIFTYTFVYEHIKYQNF